MRIFDFTQDLKRRGWLRRLVNEGKVERIYVDPLDTAHGCAIDETDGMVSCLPHSPRPTCRAQRALSRLLGDSQGELVLKKALLPDVFEYEFVLEILQDLENTGHPPPRLHPRSFLAFHRVVRRLFRPAPPLASGAKRPAELACVPRWERVLEPLLGFLDISLFKIIRLSFTLLQITLLVLGKLLPTRARGPAHFRHAVAIEQRFQLALEGKRYFDFLLDGQTVTAANTAFVFRIPVSHEVAGYCRDREYAVLDLTHLRRPGALLQAKPPWKSIGCALNVAIGLSLPFAGPACFVQAAVRSLQVFIEQITLDRTASFDHYLYANQEHPKQLALNILLRRRGTQTWNYTLAIGGTFIYATDRTDDLQAKRHHLWAYLNSDHYVGASPDAVTYHRLHSQAVENYHDVGCMYSQLIDEYRTEQPPEALRATLFARSVLKSARVVAMFDTTYVYDEQAVTTYADGLAFYRDILRLLEEMPDLHVIIKPSKGEHYYVDPAFQWSFPPVGEEIMALWDQLKTSPRVCWAGIGGDVPAIIAAADLTVTACMSSPTFEALGAGCKAVWYDPRQRCRGVLFDDAPGLICHGYDAWKARIEELLATDDDSYGAWLDAHVHGKIETYTDSHGLDRFRTLIRDSDTGTHEPD